MTFASHVRAFEPCLLPAVYVASDLAPERAGEIAA